MKKSKKPKDFVEEDMATKQSQTYAQISMTDFFILTYAVALNPFESKLFFENMLYNGTCRVYLAYWVMVIFLSMPTVGIQLFLSTYSKYSFIKIWDLFPAFRGIGYMTAISLTVENVYCVSRLLISVYMISASLHSSWLNCKFPHEEKCVPLQKGMLSPYINCTNHDPPISIEFSSLVYLRKFYPYERFTHYSKIIYHPTLTKEFSIYLACIWVIIFILSCIELKKILKFYKAVFVICLFYISIIFVVASIQTYVGGYRKPEFYGYKNLKLEDFVIFFLDMCHVASHQERPGIFLFLASRTNLVLEPHSISRIIYAGKLIGLGFVFLTVFNSLDVLENYYGVADDNCLVYDQIDTIYGVIPTSFTTWIGPQTVYIVMWYLFLILWELPTVLVSIHAVILSTAQMHAIMPVDFKFILPMIYCGISYCISLLLLRYETSPIMLAYEGSVKRHGTYLSLVLFSIAILVYSIRNIQHDYKFKYGLKTSISWMLVLKISLCIHCTALIFQWFSMFSIGNKPWYYEEYEMHTLILVYIFFHCPLVIVFFVEYYKHKSFSQIFRTYRSWGPPGRLLQVQRSRFKPDIIERFRVQELQFLCKHNCLAESDALKTEKDFYYGKLQHFKELYRAFSSENKEGKDYDGNVEKQAAPSGRSARGIAMV